MTFNYHNKRLKSNLNAAIYSIIAGIILLGIDYLIVTDENYMLFSIGLTMVISSLFYYLTFQYEKKKQYLSIVNNTLIKHTLFSKKIDLNKIVSMKQFADEITLITTDKTLKIDKNYLDKKSLEKLLVELKNLP